MTVKMTDEPSNWLTRLAKKMGDARGNAPGVRGVIMLNDADGGAVHPVGYDDSKTGQATLFVDTCGHLMALGDALGIKVKILLNGKEVKEWPTT